MTIRLTKDEVFKMLHCPKCKGLLQTYECIVASPFCYCPNCDILKTRILSLPYLCKSCDSEIFIGSSHYSLFMSVKCFLCGDDMRSVSVKEFHSLHDKGKLKRGYFVSNGHIADKYFTSKHLPCHKKTPTLTRHNKNIFKGTCEECDFVVYILIPDWLQEKHKFTDKDVIEIATIEAKE